MLLGNGIFYCLLLPYYKLQRQKVDPQRKIRLPFLPKISEEQPCLDHEMRFSSSQDISKKIKIEEIGQKKGIIQAKRQQTNHQVNRYE